MTLKRTIKLLKEYLRMNNLNVIELTNVNKYRPDEINKEIISRMKLKKEKI